MASSFAGGGGGGGKGPALLRKVGAETKAQQQQQQQQPPPQQQQGKEHRRHEKEEARGANICMLLVGGGVLFAAVFVLVSILVWRPQSTTTPTTKNGPSRGGGGGGGGGRGRDQCTVDEDFNEKTQMCAMRPHYPRAVSEAIMDTTVSPCTDAYRHACGKWIDQHTNENRGFSGLAAINEAATTEIVLDETVTAANNLFQSCDSTLVATSAARRKRNWRSHTAETNAARYAILRDMLEPIYGKRSTDTGGLAVTFARMVASDYTIPFSFNFQSHPTGKGLIPGIAYNGFDGKDMDIDWVTMHFEILYGKDSSKARDEAGLLIDMVAKLNLAMPDMTVLTSMSGWTSYIKSGAVATDLMTWAKFKSATTSTFDWDLFLSSLETRARLSTTAIQLSPGQEVWAYSLSYFQWFHPERFSTEQWTRFIEWSVLYHTHDFFPRVPNNVLFNGDKLSGDDDDDDDGFSKRAATVMRKRRLPVPGKDQEEREKRRRNADSRRGKKTSSRKRGPRDGEEEEGREVTTADCIRVTKFLLPGVVSQEYLKRNFQRGEFIRERVKEVVERIKERFVKNILGTAWMDEPTRLVQAEKIRSIVARVVHPNEWEAEQLEMRPDTYLRNLNLIQQDRVRRNLILWSESNNGAKCGPSCRDKITAFGSSLSTVNAWYNPDRNVITIPAGILQPPFFEERYDNVSMYATIGVIIGHELSHGLDPHGSQFDKDGILRETWSEQARKEYRARAMCIVHEYGSPEGCNNADYGEQTLCEDTADIVGVRLAYEALSPSGKKDQQDFFTAFGQMWCSSYEPDVICDRANSDVHAIAAYRVRKTLAHIPYYAEAHDCPVGSPMHRPEQTRCVIYISQNETNLI